MGSRENSSGQYSAAHDKAELPSDDQNNAMNDHSYLMDRRVPGGGSGGVAGLPKVTMTLAGVGDGGGKYEEVKRPYLGSHLQVEMSLMERAISTTSLQSAGLIPTHEADKHPVSVKGGPEPGWQWVVLVASFLAQGLAIGMPFSVGVYFVEWVSVFGQGQAVTAWVGSINCGLVFGAGPLASTLCNKYGHRVAVMTGAFLCGTGTLLSAFATNVYVLYVTYGLMAGVGFCLIYIPAIGVVGLYFTARRTLALGLAVTGAAVGALIMPLLLRVLISEYGWRGAMLLSAAMCYQVLVFGALFIPVDYWSSPVKARFCLELNTVHPPTDLRTLCDLALLRDFRFVVMFLNKLMWNLGSLVLFVLIVDYAIEGAGMTKDTGALLLSISGLVNAGGRLTAAVLGSLPWCNKFYLFFVANILTGVSLALIPCWEVPTGFMVLLGCFGFFLGVQIGCLAVLTADLFGVHRLTSAYGLQNIGDGAGALVGPPIGGALLQVTGSYRVPFYFAGAITVLSALLLLHIPLLDKDYRKTTRDRDHPAVIVEETVTYTNPKS